MRIVPKEELARKKAKAKAKQEKKKLSFWQKLQQRLQPKSEKKEQQEAPASRRFLTAAELDQQSDMRFAVKLDPNKKPTRAESREKNKTSGKSKKFRWKKSGRRLYQKLALFFASIGKFLWRLLQWSGQTVWAGICCLGRISVYLAKKLAVVPQFFVAHRRLITLGVAGLIGITLLGLLGHYAIQYLQKDNAATKNLAKPTTPPRQPPKQQPQEPPKQPQEPPKQPQEPPKDPTKPPKDPGKAVLPGEVDRK